jgi:hypothetical protein
MFTPMYWKESKQLSWTICASVKNLDESAKRQILEHAATFGFDPKIYHESKFV